MHFIGRSASMTQSIGIPICMRGSLRAIASQFKRCPISRLREYLLAAYLDKLGLAVMSPFSEMMRMQMMFYGRTKAQTAARHLLFSIHAKPSGTTTRRNRVYCKSFNRCGSSEWRIGPDR